MDTAKKIGGLIQRSRCLQSLVVAGLLGTVYLYYFLGSNTKITAFRDNTTRKPVVEAPSAASQQQNNLLSVSDSDAKLKIEPAAIDVMITFTNAENKADLQDKFRVTVRSLFRFVSVKVNLLILGDSASEKIARNILLEEVPEQHKYMVSHLDIESLVKQVHETVSEMQKYFTSSGSYYSDALFFLSIVSHTVLPQFGRLIMMDCDLKFDADIYQLYQLFDQFTEQNVIGIGLENQPVYQHVFSMYRNKNTGTRVGGPPPDGLTGFNSGVLLLDLDKMRKSSLYNSLISGDQVKSLTEKYMFKGHLGDQDFYTLISMDHEELFYILPCTWNRQLCTWWRDHGYKEVFDQYFNCDGHINIYHGNCNTKIPILDWER